MPRPSFKKGEPLPEVTRAKGVMALGRMALRILQQQLQVMQGKHLDEPDRAFLINATKLLLDARKVRMTDAKDGRTGGVQLPALDPKT